MNTIERTPWFIQDTAGTESIEQFTSVVEKNNQELAKKALNNPNFAREDGRSSGVRMRIVRDVLIALWEDEDNQSDAEDEETEEGDDEGPVTEIEHKTLFEGQSQYGVHPNKFRGRNGRQNYSKPGHVDGRYRRPYG